MLYNKKCTVEYDGRGYVGWQAQKNGIAVQEHIEKALKTIYKEDITTLASGRTDSGVHAMGQVFGFRSEKYLECEKLLRGMNSLLPRDISILKVEDVPERFHPQKSATSKTYLYKIHNSDRPSAFLNWRAWWIKKQMDADVLAEYLNCFKGTHDFASFCIRASLKENTVRTINTIELTKQGTVIDVEINGSGFLHQMVRLIMGTVVDGFFRNYTTGDIMDVIKSKNIENSGFAAPACGLYLKKVFY